MVPCRFFCGQAVLLSSSFVRDAFRGILRARVLSAQGLRGAGMAGAVAVGAPQLDLPQLWGAGILCGGVGMMCFF